MSRRIYTDSASGTLLAQVDPADLTVTLNASQGDRFPMPTGNDYAILTLEDTDGNIEMVKLTSRIGDTLTVVRAQEGTIARTFPASTSRCELRVTASTLNGLAPLAETQIGTW